MCKEEIFLVWSKESDLVDKTNYWAAELSDGTVVYEDKRPGILSTFNRLKHYLSINSNISVQKIMLQSCGRSVIVDERLDGFFLSKTCLTLVGGPSMHLTGIGNVRDNKAFVTWIAPNGLHKQILLCQDGDPRILK